MNERLIVVSNRLPMGDTPSGGLVVSLHDVLAASGGCWIGSHPEAGDDHGAFERIGEEPYQRLAFRLTQSEMENYYLGYANSVLWPLCHRRPDLVKIRPAFREAYEAVNRRIAAMIAREVGPEDIIWVQDYHFIPLARELRKLGVTNRIGFFLHIPFPVLADLSIMPQAETFAECLAHYNLIGLQTREDVARCLEMFRDDPRAEFMTDGSIKFGEHVSLVHSFPIGIDAKAFEDEARRELPDVFGGASPAPFAIGVDRLDYSKGLPNRFRAFGTYLADLRPEDTRPCLIQIAPPTRLGVQAYEDITEELQGLTGKINGQFAELDWTPIRFINRSVERARLAHLFRMARCGLVTSLADGMNLVAKEYIAAQDPADPGVLVLSQFAGAAEDMTEALLVNPYDIEAMAHRIDEAFRMPLGERQRRYRHCLEVVRKTDATSWAHNFLNVLRSSLKALDLAFQERELQPFG
ncbi:alpha,alpha-trehalose-phosphate synthase (UDP-forming) [Novosphingobium sp. MBES04]|uniref:alpha,alpha-trehalose-phosphate synthase (UDP-forming) n=1 Tax=Novosphingobium sp. MBES04 TaxID=1206458 RepID=UPI0006931FD3|nr:trehalose-6-phosphate synthase [Novosphingobium sp. MBES04]GAM04989.1 alpha,alpha-trehalose-phosphate synthase [Novosphingobium sp. MBES04]